MQEALRKASTPLVALLLVATLFAAYQVGNIADATHQPADKPFAAASNTVKFSPGTNVTLLTATVKNSKPTDMILQVSMECSILTNNVIMGSGTSGATQTSQTTGTVRAWIEIDGQTVPIISSSSPPQNPGSTPPNDEASKVTFCNRVFNRTSSDREQDGIDYSEDYIETKTANAFNWVRLNMGSGPHTIVLKADLSHFATDATGSSARAYVGNRSMIGIPGKFANDAVIAEGGSS